MAQEKAMFALGTEVLVESHSFLRFAVVVDVKTREDGVTEYRIAGSYFDKAEGYIGTVDFWATEFYVVDKKAHNAEMILQEAKDARDEWSTLFAFMLSPDDIRRNVDMIALATRIDEMRAEMRIPGGQK